MTHDVKDWMHCTGCSTCRAKRWEQHVIRPTFWAGIGETHPEYYKKLQSRKFHKDMDSYHGARKSGLQPEKVSSEAVEKAEKRAYIEEKVMRRN